MKGLETLLQVSQALSKRLLDLKDRMVSKTNFNRDQRVLISPAFNLA